MLIHCDAFDIRGDLFEKWRVSFPVSLLRTHCSQERVANDKDIGQRGRDEHPVGVLGQAPIAHLGEAEHALDDPDRMLHARADARLGAILRLDRRIGEMLPLAGW